MRDRGCKYLGRFISCLLIPALIKFQLRVDAFEFILIIDIKDVHHLAGGSTVPGNTLFINRDPDFADFVPGLNP